MTRSPKQPILYEDKLNVPEKYLRFATPEVVALYRADRLCSGDFANTNHFLSGGRVGISERNRNIKLVEIGAGIGGQTFAFAKVCKKVLSIESDKSSANILIQNLKKLKIENVEVIVADALSKKAVERIKNFNPEIIFCDTERPEKAERTLENIKPSIKKLLEIFSETTSKIAIEIPPFTDTKNLNENFEREFISVNQQLNRLTLYLNELKQSEVSAISLPSRERIVQSKSKVKNVSSVKGYDYLYAIDPTIVVAGLTSEFNSPVLELNKPVLLSNKKINSNFLTGYKIVSICKNEQKTILQNLKKIDAERFRGSKDRDKQAMSGVGKIVLRYNILPQDYWKIRNSYEKELSGKREISLFIDDKNNEAILCEKNN
jgi:16S rRNA G966 N2-methylase RsmD